MIKFTDIFKVSNPKKTKVKFNMVKPNLNEPAWDCLKSDKEEWIMLNAHRKSQANNNLDNYDFVLTFAQYYPYGPNYYIFGGMYRVEKIVPEIEGDYGYKLTLLKDFSDYRKRLIIKLSKPIGRDIYCRKYSNLQNSSLKPEVYEILPSLFMGDFPGFENVLLTHNDLKTIIQNDSPLWKNALSNVKGVYCITDTKTGKLYIGSAYGNNEGIWQRWSQYANCNNLTGGNKAFEEIKIKNPNYIPENFTYSILEIFDMKTKEETIIQRENHWKDVFKSKKFGYNKN